MPSDMSNKFVFISGGATGIGEAAAMELLNAGATVIINFLPNQEKLIKANELLASNTRCKWITGDIAESSTVNKLIYLLEFNGWLLDICILNAAVMELIPGLMTSGKNLCQTIHNNALSHICICEKLKGHMNTKGKVIAIGTCINKKCMEGAFSYTISKAILESYLKGISEELAAYKLGTAVLICGFTDTDLIKKIILSKRMEKNILNKIPMGRIADITDIIIPLLYLINSDNWIGYRELSVDGGFSLSV